MIARAPSQVGIQGAAAADLPRLRLPTREVSVLSRAASRRAGLTQLMRLASVPAPPADGPGSACTTSASCPFALSIPVAPFTATRPLPAWRTLVRAATKQFG